ncbi:E3 ubiquitin-protein ligase UPL5-like [Impatiens glandulifera]|uniref:E3 ubiquitin-protein ligase UPL5-like n=1 Tax=Impatiens glandulifera TaxID=253017 RepID=UPI001FB089D7|nr:E3 ubiquitin-protein ligase UPL5-like [Impatiens glandulifera]
MSGYPVDRVHQLNERISSKRKLDDSGSSGNEEGMSELATFRARRDDGNQSTMGNQQSLYQSGVSGHIDSIYPVFRLQFFVRQISDGTALVLHGNPEDSVESVHQRIRSITGIPMLEQRLIYRGKQLQWDQSLGECLIQNDSELQLVGRMRSTHYPLAWQLLGDLISHILRRCKGDLSWPLITVTSKLMEFLEITFGSDSETTGGHLEVFLASAAPSALVMLYMSPRHGNKECAAELIRKFVISCRGLSSASIQIMIAPILLEFCKLLSSASRNDHLYSLCRSSLGSIIGNVRISGDTKLSDNDNNEGAIQFTEIFPIFSVIAFNLSEDLGMSAFDPMTRHGPRLSDVRDFAAFSAAFESVVKSETGSICLSFDDDDDGGGGKNKLVCSSKEIRMFCEIYTDLVKKIETCLSEIEDLVDFNGGKEEREEEVHQGWSLYLAILKVLNGMSKIYKGGHKQLWMKLLPRKNALCFLIMHFAKNAEEDSWILEIKDATDFESRRHLTMMMLPEVKDDDFDEQHEMLIDRTELLVESYQYITHADPSDLRRGLRMEFKNEEASGPGVLREWFFLVCQAIFNPENSLFLTSRSDRRRFYPNPVKSTEGVLLLEYYKFAGKLVALALTHKVQVGILLDRILFVQLAGFGILLEDIRDAEPEMYSSCKKILEMEAEEVDSDVLGLTFVREVEEMGNRKVVELCPGGKGICVNSLNRIKYVNLLIHHTFVKSMSLQVGQFAAGFEDIMRKSSDRKAFFRGLELGDLDMMLHGEDRAVPVDDWMKHTGYNGYKKTDPQIIWFWKIVEEMSTESRKNLLFFWTSVKYLPLEGFGGLGSRLLICIPASTDENHLPSSHTCFYRLCLPAYSSMPVMKEKLRIITQEHVSGSFGTL